MLRFKDIISVLAHVNRTSPTPRISAKVGLAAIAFVCSGTLLADSKLSENSPFLPPGYGEEVEEKPAVQPQGPISRELEFRGIFQMNGVYQFSIFNKKAQKAYWLKEGEREDGIIVTDYNESSTAIVVAMNGRSERLTLMSASENPLPVAKSQATLPTGQKPTTLPQKVENKNTGTSRKVVPRRRRVILPKKN